MINSLAKGLEKLAMIQSESLLFEAKCVSLSLSLHDMSIYSSYGSVECDHIVQEKKKIGFWKQGGIQKSKRHRKFWAPNIEATEL